MKIVIACLIFAICLFQFAGTGAVFANEKTGVIIASADSTSDEATDPIDEEGTVEDEIETDLPDEEAPPLADEEAPPPDEGTPKSE